jgi:CheY-like chemotaxis protein
MADAAATLVGAHSRGLLALPILMGRTGTAGAGLPRSPSRRLAVRSKPSLLIVEDEPGLRYLARLMLSADFAVDDVENGEAALERVAAHRYDVIMLDVMMPGLDGYAVCERIRAMPGGAEPKILFCTGRGGINGRARGRQAGAEGYVVKPFSPTALRTQLKDLLLCATQPVAIAPEALSA